MTISEANSMPVVEARQHLAAHGAHPAVRVADAGAEEQVEQPGEDRVADVPVQPGHRAGLDVVHAVADHHLGALLERGDEAGNLVEVVCQVGVRHHDVAATRGLEPGEVGAAVAAPVLDHHAGARLLGQPRGVVLGVVIGDDDLAVHPHAHDRLQGGADARGDVLRLVQARDHDRHERQLGVVRVRRGGRCACRGDCAHRLKVAAALIAGAAGMRCGYNA
jgi:hypothetical protein